MTRSELFPKIADALNERWPECKARWTESDGDLRDRIEWRLLNSRYGTIDVFGDVHELDMDDAIAVEDLRDRIVEMGFDIEQRAIAVKDGLLPDAYTQITFGFTWCGKYSRDLDEFVRMAECFLAACERAKEDGK